MSEHNPAMAAMLAAAAPAARDAGFEIAVLARIERRRFRRALLLRLGQALAAALVLALLMPALAPVGEWTLRLGGQALPVLQVWPQGAAANLALGIALMAVSLALPWWRRA